MWFSQIDGVYTGDCRPGDRPATDAEIAAQRAATAPVLTVINKADIWRRATDAEAFLIDAQLNAQPVRLRRMWQDAQTLSTTDELYPAIRDAFVAAFGPDRAAQLLEPTS